MPSSNENLRDAFEKEKAYRKQIEAKHAKLVEAAEKLHAEFDSIWNSSRTPTREQVHAWGVIIRKALENEQ